MSLLVTGANGFVMSNLVRGWLERHPGEQVTALDREAPDETATRFYKEVADRIHWIRADILDRRAWHAEAQRRGIDCVMHGAALTPHPWTDRDGVAHDPEREEPERVLDVNLGGTLAVLDLVRKLDGCRRVLMVGTASVYPDQRTHNEPCAEDSPVQPVSLYAISKHAAELVARRFTELYKLPVVTVRLGAVYGPMDRVLASRHVICAPNRMTTLALDRSPIRLAEPDGVGDWIHVADVVAALIYLIEAPRLNHGIYNVATGEVASLAQLADLITSIVPAATWSAVREGANVSADPGRRKGQWGGYDVRRITRELAWTPGALKVRLASYVAWRSKQAIEGDQG